MRTAVRLLIILNIACFALELGLEDTLIETSALWPVGKGFEPWQLLTNAFLHANILHLAANMFGLWMFGRNVERAIGSAWFLRLYGASVLSAGCTQLLAAAYFHQAEPTIGASGGVFGVLAAFAMLFPKQRVALLFPPLLLPAWLFVAGYALIELFSGLEGVDTGIAHFAHIGGLLGGIGALHFWRNGQLKQLTSNRLGRFPL